MKLWLIEVNASPSLTASNKEDYEMKFGLLWDTLDVIDMENSRKGDELRVGGFDLAWNEELPEKAHVRSHFTARKPQADISSFNNFAVHLDPLVQNSFIFGSKDKQKSTKYLPTYPTNCFIGCPYERQKIVLET